MVAMLLRDGKAWLKQGRSPLARGLFQLIKVVRLAQLPRIPLLFMLLYRAHQLLRTLTQALLRVFWWTPLFRARVGGSCTALYLYGGLPLIGDGLQIRVGARCRISGHTTFSARACGARIPQLIIGNNVDVGWQNTIAVGSKVVLGDNVRLASNCFIAGYPGHPLDPAKRAQGLPDEEWQVGEVILERDVWLGTGVAVMAGVTIGAGTVVAAGSVVSKDLPAGVLAAGVPARVVRALKECQA